MHHSFKKKKKKRKHNYNTIIAGAKSALIACYKINELKINIFNVLQVNKNLHNYM